MFRQVWLWAVVALPAVVLGVDTYMGDGTANDVGQAAAGKCTPGIGENYAALNSDQWNSTLNCGRCVQVSCDDSRCSDTAVPVTVYVVGECTECADEGLDMSPAAFKKLTGSEPTRYTISWQFTDCPTTSGNSFSTLKSTGTGSGKNYQAGTVSAANETPSTVTILQANADGVEKTSTTTQQDSSDNAKDSSPGTSPFFIALGVLAAVCAVALAAVAYSAKKKKWNEKGDCVTRSFDTFSSPAQTKATIVKI